MSTSQPSDLTDYQRMMKTKSIENKPYWIADVFKAVFHRPAPYVHWYLLHRAISYRKLYLDGGLVNYKLQKRYREACLLKPEAISEKESRLIVEYYMQSRDVRLEAHIAEQKRIYEFKPKKGAHYGLWAIEQFMERFEDD